MKFERLTPAPACLLPSRNRQRDFVTLAILICLCLAPRCWMAANVPYIYADGACYLGWAEALDQGDVESAFKTLKLNVYPILLVWLHRLGLEWETAGKVWGVFISTATVLPLFGWARRQFDRRIAIGACVLFAIHPRLIEWSPEIIRDSTFWFLLVLCLYLSWRAAAEANVVLFLLTGLAITLAVHTRIEGWLALIPLLYWTASRMWRSPADRPSLMLGAAVCLLIGPLAVVLLNVTWLANHSRWEFGRFGQLRFASQWVETQMGGLSQTPLRPLPSARELEVDFQRNEANRAWNTYVAMLESGVPFEARSLERLQDTLRRGNRMWRVHLIREHLETLPCHPSAKRLLWGVRHTLGRSFTPLFAVAALAGLCLCLPVWLRHDHLPIVCLMLGIAAGITLFLWQMNDITVRYGLSLVVLSTPYAAIGAIRASQAFLAVCCYVGRISIVAFRSAKGRPFAERKATFCNPAPNLAAAMLLASWFAIALGSWTDALSQRDADRQWKVQLGQWIHRAYGPGCTIGGPDSMRRLVGYYSRGRYVPVDLPLGAADVFDWAQTIRPRVVILSTPASAAERYRRFQAEHSALGYRSLPAAELPAGCEHLAVFVQEPYTNRGEIAR